MGASSMSNEYTVSSYLRDVLSSGTATERAVAHTALTMLERQQKQPLTDEDLHALAMASCGVMHADVLHMGRKQCIAFGRKVLAAAGVPVLGERERFEAWSKAKPDGGFTLDRYTDPQCDEYVHYNTQWAWEAWQARAALGVAACVAPRFDKTYCSQCGGEFGPGDQGYSHCKDHANRPAPVRACVWCSSTTGQHPISCTNWRPSDVPTTAPTFTDEQLAERYTKSHGGPNPYYACRACGEDVPGLRELLVEHAATHGVTAPDHQTFSTHTPMNSGSTK